MHVSTAFVVGNRSGLVFEDEEIVGYFPRKGELDGRDFSLEDELDDAGRLVKRLREQAEDHALTSEFRARALERLEEEGRDPRDEKTLRLAVGRERKLWLTQKLTEAGMDRARSWGWPNTYTYTKSLGEQVIAGTPDLRYAIVRPSIVESALRYPFPGWNEGFTTSAPLAFAGLKGHRMVPAAERTILDIIPVDLVAGSLIAITARARDATPSAACTSRPRATRTPSTPRARWSWWASTGGSTSATARPGSALLNDVKSRHRAAAGLQAELPHPVGPALPHRRAAPPQGHRGPRAALGRAARLGDAGAAPRSSWSGWRSRPPRSRCSSSCSSPSSGRTATSSAATTPASLYAAMDPEDAAKIPWDPHAIDWRRYFLEVHLPGLEKWVFPGLEEERERRKAIHAHRDLLELFDAAVHAYRHRVAFRRVEDEREERFTYGEVHRWAARVGSFLLKSGVKPGDRVLLVSENRPEWPIAYFGILRAGATVVPVDPASSEAEVVNIVRRSAAKVVPALRGRRARPRRAVAHALRAVAGGQPRHPGPGDGGRPGSARAHRAGAQERRAGRRGLAHLHLRHHRHAQGGDAHPPELRLAGAEARRPRSTSAWATGCSRCSRCTTPSSSPPGCSRPSAAAPR